MQKKVIALAVAALASGVAMAQSNVTVYGIMAAEYMSANTTNVAAGSVKNMRGVADNPTGSRIGFRGEEGLGNGLTASFVHEYGISTVQNDGAVNSTGDKLQSFQTRQSYVALTSNVAGEIALGRFQTIGYNFMADARPWGGYDPLRTVANSLGYISANTSDRFSNAARYTSPVWAGFSVQGMYSNDIRNGSGTTAQDRAQYDWLKVDGTGRQTGYQLGAKYENGPVGVAAFMRHQSAPAGVGAYNMTSTSTSPSDAVAKNEWGLRGAYDFNVVKVGAVYHRVTLKDALTLGGGTNAGQTFKSGYYYGGYATVPVGSAVKLTLEAAKANGDASQGAYMYTFIGEYIFSKRTSGYAQLAYAKMNNENYAAQNLGTYGLGVEAGKSVTGVMMGLKHSF